MNTFTQSLAGFFERTAQHLPGYVAGALWYVALFVGLQYALHWAVRERSEA